MSAQEPRGRLWGIPRGLRSGLLLPWPRTNSHSAKQQTCPTLHLLRWQQGPLPEGRMEAPQPDAGLPLVWTLSIRTDGERFQHLRGKYSGNVKASEFLTNVSWEHKGV